ncbi:M1 family metallopeptidase [Novosphingobium profundi]|uniref:M1 family metallopeptidase n=1 Tax=Novosphingobium profundi TaxID=1774954 RepID=UPI001BDAE0EE|nr:M1 family metallopeptidase [Novosphingobium profundi]MBT0669827.1 M1 family metallopeptidase [Novosphingobium profundi]
MKIGSPRAAAASSAIALAALATLAPGAAAAQYDPLESFAPFTMPMPVNSYRSSNGLPGPDYWQNQADYEIHARLNPNPKAPSLSGSEVISYTNNSPDALDVLWLQLDQNSYKADSRGTFAGGRPRPASTQGAVLDKVEVETAGGFVDVPFLVSDTRMRVTLPEALKGKGGALKLRVAWHFEIPGEWGGRMAWGQSKKGPIYDLAQWYPRMAVYDDVRGWDTAPYLAQEFYLEYGNFDYYVTVPADMLVFGSGELVNAEEVLTKEQQARLAKARTSDATVMIRSPAEVAKGPGKASGTRTWHYHMNDTRDVAFTASAWFAWDAARINLPGGKTSLAMSVYPLESQGKEAWGRSTEYLKNAVENFSKRWYPYPWPAAINVAGPASGMEYPGIVFDGIEDKGKELFWITAHEIGHGWFPMIVGFDERRHAWMDEGFNTFIDTYESDDFNHGEYGPKRDGEYAPGGGNPVDEIQELLADPKAPILLSRSDTVLEKYRHPMSYFKSALGLRLLREEILGPDRFDPAFRRFIAAWAFKHPQPSDFFRAMESEGGEDLSYFWNGWYAHNWTMDLAIDAIGPVDEKDPAKGTAITVGVHDKLVMPATLRVTYAGGTHEDIRLPAESWIRNAATVVTVPAGKRVVSAEVDPDHALPDKDRANNLRTAPAN